MANLTKQKLISIFSVTMALAMLSFLATTSNTVNANPVGSVQIDLTEIATRGSDGSQAQESSFHPYLSADGRYLGFVSFENTWFPENNSDNHCIGGTESLNCLDAFIRDRELGVTTKLSYGYDGRPGNQRSFGTMVSDDGQTALFNSFAWNIVPNDTNQGSLADAGLDTFVWKSNGTTNRVSLTVDGGQIDGNNGGVLSADGRYVVYDSDGEVVPGINPDTNHKELYLKDLQTNTVERLPITQDGAVVDGRAWGYVISDDISRIMFVSESTNILAPPVSTENIYVHNRDDGTTILASKNQFGGFTNGSSGAPNMSRDGRYVVYTSSATDIIGGDSNGEHDVFMYDIETDQTIRVSKTPAGGWPNGGSYDPVVCNGGKYVVYTSDASNIINGDNNGVRDGFLYDVARDETHALSRTAAGVWANGLTHKVFISADCSTVAFSNDGDNLMPGDANGAYRDIVIAEVREPADFINSYLTYQTAGQAGDTMDVTVIVENSGDLAETVDILIPDSPYLTYVPGSEMGGIAHVSGVMTWSGSVAGGETLTFGFSLEIDPALTEPTLITIGGSLNAPLQTIPLDAGLIVGGIPVYLPYINQ